MYGTPQLRMVVGIRVSLDLLMIGRWILWSSSFQESKKRGCHETWKIGCFRQCRIVESFMLSPSMMLWSQVMQSLFRGVSFGVCAFLPRRVFSLRKQRGRP